MQLRPFQEDLVSGIRSAFGRTDAVLACSPTGSGKTVIMSHIVNRMAANNKRVLIICHREELIRQTSQKLHAHGVLHGMVGGGFNHGLYQPVVVGTIQSVARRKFQNIDCIIFDECHLSKAASWVKVREQYSASRLLGFSATPTRLDGSGFDDMYGEMVMGPSVAQLIGSGYLTRYRAFAPSIPALTGVHTVSGEFNLGELANAMGESKLVGNIICNWKEIAGNRRTLLFAVNRRHSERMASEFQADGISADFIDGSMSKQRRREILSRFGKSTQVLCSVMLFTEGFDRPDIDALILARPTKSLALHLQMIGRGLRIHPGKQDCIILDHSGNILRHGFPDEERQWDLKGRKRKPSERGELPEDQLPRVCPQCQSLCRHTDNHCACGYKFAVAISRKQMDEVDGQLQEVTRQTYYSLSQYTQAAGDYSEDAGVQSIITRASSRGWKPGAVHVQTKLLLEARDRYRQTIGTEPKPHWNVAVLNSIMEVQSRKNASQAIA